MIPSKNDLTILFAHVAYQLSPQFELRKTGIRHSQAWTYDELASKVADADVLVVSGLWRNDLLPKAKKLRFIQSVGAGTDQFARDQLTAQKIRLASASGVNQRAVSEHAMSLLLALARKLPEARDNQAKKVWRGMISDLSQAGRRARRQDLADHRIGRHRKPAGAPCQGVRSSCCRDQAQSRDRQGRRRCRARLFRFEDASAAGGFCRADLPADAGDGQYHRCGDIGRDEAIGLFDQLRARALRERSAH